MPRQPLVNLNQRRTFLNNAELVRRLQAAGEHSKASMLFKGTSGRSHAMNRGFRAAEQQGDHSAAQREETQQDLADFGQDVAGGMHGGSVSDVHRHAAVARIGHTQATKLGNPEVEGKLPRRYGLQMVPTFEQAISQKPSKVSLPPLKATTFWNSPAYQALLNMQQQVETDAELEVRRSSLEALMRRVARERRVPLAHVRTFARTVAEADVDDPVGRWWDDDDDGDEPDDAGMGVRTGVNGGGVQRM